LGGEMGVFQLSNGGGVVGVDGGPGFGERGFVKARRIQQ
jgi:hypothetical protein